jgi:outer membrane protein assembly factor BamB
MVKIKKDQVFTIIAVTSVPVILIWIYLIISNNFPPTILGSGFPLEPKWRISLDSQVKKIFVSTDGNILLSETGSSLYAVDPFKGVVIWKFGLPILTEIPGPIVTGGGKVYFSNNQKLWALDEKNESCLAVIRLFVQNSLTAPFASTGFLIRGQVDSTPPSQSRSHTPG